MSKIGTAINNLRVERNLKQGELAAIVGISRVSLSHIENDSKRPSEKNLSKISKALGVNTGYFYVMSLHQDDVSIEIQPVYDILYPIFEKMAIAILKTPS